MNERDFSGLLQGVKEMTAQMRGELVAGAIETNISDPGVRSIREAAETRKSCRLAHVIIFNDARR